MTTTGNFTNLSSQIWDVLRPVNLNSFLVHVGKSIRQDVLEESNFFPFSDLVDYDHHRQRRIVDRRPAKRRLQLRWQCHGRRMLHGSPLRSLVPKCMPRRKAPEPPLPLGPVFPEMFAFQGLPWQRLLPNWSSRFGLSWHPDQPKMSRRLWGISFYFIKELSFIKFFI